jgi:hypothetical protein
MALKLQPPYVLCAMFCKLVGPAKDPTGIAEFITQLTITLPEAAGKTGVVFEPNLLPALYVMLAQGGIVGERTINVIHRPPTGPALPRLTSTGRMVAGLSSIGIVFNYEGRLALAAGMHLFDIVYDDRVLTQVPLVIQLGPRVLQ